MKAVRVLTVTLAVLAPAWLTAQEPRLVIEVFAHRGFTRAAPENSMAALRAARALGVAGAEIDLRSTRDGQVVLMHDATLERTSTGTGAVESANWSDLQRLRLRTPDGVLTDEGIPRLDEVLAWLEANRGFQVAFDVKSVDVLRVGRLVATRNLASAVIFFFDDPQQVALARQLKAVDPRLRISVNLVSWWKIEGLATFVRNAFEADALFSHEYWFPAGGFGEAVKTGAKVQVYVPGADDLVNRVRRAASLGATLVSSDRPDLLMESVERVK